MLTGEVSVTSDDVGGDDVAVLIEQASCASRSIPLPNSPAATTLLRMLPGRPARRSRAPCRRR
ncbi:hypothetical protein ACRAWF_29870 [Streptomyces sp. L7]